MARLPLLTVQCYDGFFDLSIPSDQLFDESCCIVDERTKKVDESHNYFLSHPRQIDPNR